MNVQVRTQRPPTLFYWISLFVLIAIVFAPFAPAEAARAGTKATNINSLLDDYSRYLSSDTTAYKTAYSSEMADLVQERMDFYAEYYKTGLHLKLDTLESSFFTEDSTSMMIRDGVTRVTVLEMVTMYGHSIITKAEDYLLIAAAQWAIENTDNESVQKTLQEYLKITTDGANESISEGVKITFRVQHEIDILNTDGAFRIIRDEFTDKESDNGDGIDNVTWIKDRPIRNNPDFTTMLEYRIYTTPIEVLGQRLLEDYTKAAEDDIHHTPQNVSPLYYGNFTYNRAAARDYALTYVVQTNNSCYSNNTSYFMDTDYYNPRYDGVWSYTTTNCKDGADYVSQALEAGGFKPDDIWNDQGVGGSRAWRVFDFQTYPRGLGSYLQTVKQVIDVYNDETSLFIGDIMYTNTGQPVIVTGTLPVRYSCHTNDRYNEPYRSELTHFWHIKDTHYEYYNFADVPPEHAQWQYIERLYSYSVTAGCSTNPMNYCPTSTLNRAQMAVFILRGKYGPTYVPSAATGTMFYDVPANHWAGRWIEELAREGITAGCGNGNFCPDAPIQNDQMAVFLLTAKEGSGYQPPAATGDMFDDVPASRWAAAWIEDLVNKGIGFECNPALYCPAATVTRGNMAVLIVRAFNLP